MCGARLTVGLAIPRWATITSAEADVKVRVVSERLEIRAFAQPIITK